MLFLIWNQLMETVFLVTATMLLASKCKYSVSSLWHFCGSWVYLEFLQNVFWGSHLTDIKQTKHISYGDSNWQLINYWNCYDKKVLKNGSSVECVENTFMKITVVFCAVQVSGRVWLPVSSWLVLWLPCSGSFMTLSRSTSACPVPLPLRCQSPWRRSWASQTKGDPPPSHNRVLYLCPPLLGSTAQYCYYSCILKTVKMNCGSIL